MKIAGKKKSVRLSRNSAEHSVSCPFYCHPATASFLTITADRSSLGCMNTIAFDTHKAVKALKEAGADERLAEAVVATVGDAMG